MAIYDISTLGTPANYISFNDFKSSPLFRIQRRFLTKRQIREYDIALPESSGIDDFQAFIGKEYLIIQGKMYPANEYEYHLGREKLRKVSSLAIEQSDSYSDTGYVPYKFVENVAKQIFVKVMYVDVPESSQAGLIQPFTILCKIKFPASYAQQAQAGTITLGTTSVGTGGALIPSTIPMRIGGPNTGGSTVPFILPVVLGSTPSSSSTITLNNIGDYETFPTFVINGPIAKPKIVNVTTGEFLEFNLNLPSTSDNIIITYDQDSLSITNNGVNCYGNLTSGSVPFKIKPGTASFTLSGSSVGTGAKASVSFLPAWPLS